MAFLTVFISPSNPKRGSSLDPKFAFSFGLVPALLLLDKLEEDCPCE